jgi:hypothetical protein
MKPEEIEAIAAEAQAMMRNAANSPQFNAYRRSYLAANQHRRQLEQERRQQRHDNRWYRRLWRAITREGK